MATKVCGTSSKFQFFNITFNETEIFLPQKRRFFFLHKMSVIHVAEKDIKSETFLNPWPGLERCALGREALNSKQTFFEWNHFRCGHNSNERSLCFLSVLIKNAL